MGVAGKLEELSEGRGLVPSDFTVPGLCQSSCIMGRRQELWCQAGCSWRAGPTNVVSPQPRAGFPGATADLSTQLPYQDADQRLGAYICHPTTGLLLPPHIRQVLQPAGERVSRVIIEVPADQQPQGEVGGTPPPPTSLRVGITGYICKAGRAGGIGSRGRHQRHRGTLVWGRGGEHSRRPARPPYRGSARPRPSLPQAATEATLQSSLQGAETALQPGR